MKDFVRSAGRLRALPLPARVTYSVFLGFTLIALVESAWLGADMLGADLGQFDQYYAGVDQPPSASDDAKTAPDGAGPRIELPDEAPTPSASTTIPLRKLLEVTHFHLFSMPVYLMILSHLFMLSSFGLRAKIAWIVLGTLGVALHIVAPWLARTPGAASKVFYAGSGTLLAAAFLVMACVPLFEMWRPRRSEPARSATE